MAIKLIYPVGTGWVVTQTFADHVARAKRMGCCPKPGAGCNCYYYGGIDWGCPLGTPVYAAADGVVQYKRELGGYGEHVRLTHVDWYMTIYGHMSEVVRLTGDRVKQGDLLGYTGNTGNSTGPHLHFELRHNGIPEDPMPYLTAAPTPPEPEQPAEDWSDLPKEPTAPLIEVISTEYLRVRKDPGGDVISWLRPSARFYALAYQDGWIRIEPGWISADWVKRV